MSHHLHVQVRLHGSVIEDRLLEVRRETWLGECDGADVPFPGAILGVRARDGGLSLRSGEVLEIDAPVTRRWGPVELRLEATLPGALPRDWSWLPDPVLLVATVALLLADAFTVELGARVALEPEPDQRVAHVHGTDRAPIEGAGAAPASASYPTATFTP